jgi:hypothetical protein
MKLVGHLLRADTRRFAGVLIAWVVLVSALTVLDVVRPTFASVRVQEVLSIVHSLLGGARSVLLVVLVASVVHLHPLVGSDAFWLTRPVPPLLLLAAKGALLWPAVVLLLVVAEATVMSVYGVTPRTMTLVSLQTLLNETLWLLLIMAGAAVTLNLARFALLCGGALVALALLLASALAIAMANMNFDGPEEIAVADDGTSSLVAAVLTGIAGVVFLVVQYRSRSRVRAVLAGTAALAVALTVSWVWNVPLLAQPVELPPWTRDDSNARLSADWSTLRVTDGLRMFDDVQVKRLVTATVAVDSLPPPWSASVTLAGSTLRFRDGTTLTSASSRAYASVSLVGSASQGAGDAVATMLGVQRLFGGGPTRADTCPLLVVSSEELDRAARAEGRDEGRYEGRFHVQLTQHEIEGILPLERGAIHHLGDHRISIQGVVHSSNALALFVSESQASSSLKPAPWAQFSFYLRNGDRREGVLGSADEIAREGLLPGMLLTGWIFGAGRYGTGFDARARLLRFPARLGSDEETPALDQRWLSGAELVIVRSTTTAAALQRILRTETFSLPATR